MTQAANPRVQPYSKGVGGSRQGQADAPALTAREGKEGL